MSTINILLIEDSTTNVKIVRSFLAEGQTDIYDVTDAQTLSDGLLRLKEQSFDIVLLDLQLPDSSGMETIKAVRIAEPNTAVVVLTGSAETRVTKAAMKEGCQDFLVKGGFNGDLLRHAIRYAVERNRIEVQLRENESRLHDFAEAGADWFWEMGSDLTFSYLSKQFEESMGLEPGAFLGKAPAVIGDIKVPGADWGKYQKALQEQRSFRDLEFPIKSSEEEKQWFRISGRPVFTAAGTLQGYRGIGTEITLEKYAQWELERSKEEVEGILYTSLDGFMVLKVIRTSFDKIADFRFSHVNRRAEEMIRRSRTDLLGKLLKREMPHMVAQGIFKRAEQTVNSGAAFDVEQFYNEKGMVGWFRIIGVKMGDGVVLTLSDISAHKEAEREQRLSAAVFRTSAEGMMVCDANNCIIFVNPAFTRITGYVLDEVIGKDPKLLSSGRHPQEFYKELWDTLKKGGHWLGEIWNRRKDGEVYVQRVTISIIRNERGVIENYISVFSDTTEEKERQQKLHFKANYDALTELPNRTLLEDRLHNAIPKMKRDKAKLAIIFIDLDGFKPVNDTHGHLAGDRMLQGVAKRFTTCVRESDTVARIGGDEFVILCLDIHSPEDVEKLAQNLIDCLEKPFDWAGNDIHLGASIGISLCPDDGEDALRLVEQADKAMYEAKHAGKGTFRFFSA